MNNSGNNPPADDLPELARVLGNSLGGGVLLLGAAGQRRAFSREAARLLGWEEAGPRDLPPALLELAAKALAEGVATGPRLLKGNAAGTRAVTLRALALPAEPGRADAGVVVVLNDWTGVQQLEQQVRQLDRLANVGTLAASMAHEIRNALVAGKTFMDLLLEKHHDAELVEVVRREMGRIDTIVGRMLKFTGPTRDSHAPVSLHEVLEHSLRLVQPKLEAESIALTKSFNAATDIVKGNDRELQQAFVNLLLNALEAMGPQGTLTVSTESPPAAPYPPPADPRRLRVSIRDTGVGISPEQLPRLFEAFFTTKPSGTGLGLAITHRIVQEHAGTIQVESQPGQGSTFHILLPPHESTV